jgi:tetratricopeptide (TPR) repeat protein
MFLRIVFSSAVFAVALAAQSAAPSQSFTNSFNNNIPAPQSVVPVSTATPNPNALTPEMRGDIFMARKMYREAVEMYGQMPQSSPLTWNKIGIAYHQLAQLNLARKSYEKAVKLNPKYAEAINNLGTVAYAQRNYRRATGHYKKAIELAPASASMYSNLGTAHFARKKYEDASEAYKRALELDPNVFEHRGSNGTVLQERSVEERAKFHFYLAKLYAKGGQNERALQYLRKALEEGYKDRAKIAEDDAFALLRENPEFQTILKTEHRAL